MRYHCFKICLFSVTVILLGFMLSACTLLDVRGETGSGRVISEQRNIHGISGVNLATIGHMDIKVGDTESLLIEAEDNLMPFIETKMNNGELIVRNQERTNLQNTRPVHYYLTVKSLKSISISSSGDIQAPDLEARDFSVTINSTGDLRMENLMADMFRVNVFSTGDVKVGVLNANRIEVNIRSTGDLNIAGGTVKSQVVTINSTGDYTAENLASDEAEASLNSTGSATIWVRDRLNANLNSTGDVRYIGSPRVNEKRTSAGSIVKIG